MLQEMTARAAAFVCRSPSLITALICGFCFVVLIWMGQPVWCKCGSLVPWSWNVWSAHNSQHLVDPYSATHVLHGVLLCGLLWWSLSRVSLVVRLTIAVGLEAVWELLENTPVIIERYRSVTMSLDYYGDSAANSVVDIVACAVGFQLAQRIGLRMSVILFVIAELVLVVTIRDCLTLNIIMLVCPVDAIRQWQMAH